MTLNFENRLEMLCIRHKFSRVYAALVLAIVLIFLSMGCTSPPNGPESDGKSSGSGQEVSAEKLEPAPRVSQVPLRIWVVGSMTQSDLLMRQWHAEDDQPAEIRVLSAEELAAEQSIQADVLVYPTRLLGELIARDAIVKLPDSIINLDGRNLTDDDAAGASEQSSLGRLPALISATSYDGFQYAAPLGYSTISLIGSSASNVEEMSYDQLSARISELVADEPTTQTEVVQSEVDSDALVDRFLSVAFGKSSVNAKYGVLFDVRTMRARLTEQEFVSAAELLVSFARQRDGVSSVVGSHSVAWNWVNQAESERYAFVSASQLDSNSRSMDQGRWIRVQNGRNWNSGSGLGVSICSQCRQSAQSIRFVKWLSLSRTISSVESSLLGVVSLSGTANHLSHRINRQVLPYFNDYNLSCEPRLPLVESYRKVLADALISIIQSDSSISDGLASAARGWDEITKRQSQNQKREYERSLGMTL